MPIIIKVTDDSGNVVKNAEVTLDGEQTIKTDEKGLAIFSNILTGSHNVVVTHNSLKISRDILVDANDVGESVPIKLPPSVNITGIIVAGLVTLTALTGGVIVELVAIKRKRDSDGHKNNNTNLSLASITSGTAVPKLANHTPTNTPAIPMFDTKPSPRSLAPWELPPTQPLPTTPKVQTQTATTIPTHAIPAPTPVQQQAVQTSPATEQQTHTVQDDRNAIRKF